MRRTQYLILRFLFAGSLLLHGSLVCAQEKGYIELEDGIGLRYTVDLPEGSGPFPVLLQYQGYGAGSNPDDNGISLVSARWRELGFAILGVNLRGTGCSEGDFDLFETQWIDDARQVLDWTVAQPWSNGDVAMVGLSFPAMTQMMVGPIRHPALKALLPWSAMTDLYRDVGWPGGIFNISFATGWTGLQKSGYQYLPDEFAAGNARCLAAIAQQNDPERIVFLFGQTHPFAEHFIYDRFVPEGSVGQIDIPVLISHAWQDEQISSRATIDYEQLNPDLTWHIYGNGVHGYGLGSPTVVATAEAFLRHFLLGEDNGFPRTPKVQIEHEIAFGEPARWIETFDQWPAPTRNVELYFQPDGSLDAQRPDVDAAFDYLYPLPAPSMSSAVSAAQENQTYTLPILPGGAAIFTTPALSHDLSLLGPSRVDLWLSSTASDTDLQISLTELRPDGQEMFVQRGWLRASHRAMDMRENRANAPWHWFGEATQRPLTPGEPTPLSIEIWPVGHVFRAGSSLRLRVEAPLGTTGFRQLELNPTPAMNTVHVGPATLSRLTLPVLPGAGAPLDHPECSGQANQPCRNADGSRPPGELTVPGALDQPAPAGGEARWGGGEIRLHNTSTETHYLRAVTIDLPAAHRLHHASLQIGNEEIRIDAPKVRSRFELPEFRLAPGQQLGLDLQLEALAQSRVSLSNTAHAAGGVSHASPSWALALWLALAGLYGLQRRSRLAVPLLIGGLLVACSGGRPEAGSRGAEAAAQAFQLVAVEAVDHRGQFVRYALSP
mgnify:CR=1 FL=1